jgi:hypothetical protein
MTASLTDGEGTAPTSNFGSHSGVNSQTVHVSSSAKPRKIVFGITTYRGRKVLWGKTVVGDQTFAWGWALTTKHRGHSRPDQSQGGDDDSRSATPT